MKPECGTIQLTAQPVLGIRTTIRMAEIGQAMGPLFGEVYEYLQRSGQTPAGMPLAIYHRMEGDTVDLECALPVAAPLAGAGRIQAGELPAGTAATVTHMGPYDNLRAYVGGADGVDGIAGPRGRGSTVGGLRH